MCVRGPARQRRCPLQVRLGARGGGSPGVRDHRLPQQSLWTGGSDWDCGEDCEIGLGHQSEGGPQHQGGARIWPPPLGPPDLRGWPRPPC